MSVGIGKTLFMLWNNGHKFVWTVAKKGIS